MDLTVRTVNSASDARPDRGASPPRSMPAPGMGDFVVAGFPKGGIYVATPLGNVKQDRSVWPDYLPA